MIGLEYLCKLYDMEFQSVANELAISKQAVNQWIKGKTRISKKHYEKLKEIFKVPEEYFQKELTELDKLQLQRMKLENDAVTFTYIDKAEDGTEYKNTFTDLDVDLSIKLDSEIHKGKILKNIDNLISLKLNVQTDNQFEIDMAYEDAEKIMNLFDNLYSLIANDIYSIDRLKDILNSIDIARGKRFEGKYFTRKLANVIKEQMIKDELRLERQRKIIEECKKLEEDPENEKMNDLL